MTEARLKQPPPLDTRDSALFLDLDGTLAEFKGLPDMVGPDARRTQLLAELQQRLNGRLAILTGRTLPRVDEILEAGVMVVAAEHGLVRRDRLGAVWSRGPAPGLARVRDKIIALARQNPSVVIEEKSSSIAVHYRRAPEIGSLVREITAELAKAEGLRVQEGAMVSELCTPGPNKGDALRTIMEEAPFKGAMPVMVGDDITDESAFAAASSLGGYGVLAGALRDTHARFNLPSVNAVMNWLEGAAR